MYDKGTKTNDPAGPVSGGIYSDSGVPKGSKMTISQNTKVFNKGIN